MTTKHTLTTEEVIQEIAKMLNESDGDRIAQVYSEVMDNDASYCGNEEFEITHNR
ncbi:MAG: hypothetical protein U9N57_01065 [Pseudomonadota bacterium]|nr:hypothetical protein [Pseudomonadota bacterium]